ncbi:MAG: hypothetical protein ACJAS2_001055 [Pseudohongiellaceae bacterium]|jgi:hypothetical protein
MAKVGSVIEGYGEKHLCRDRWGMVVDPELFEHRRRMRGGIVTSVWRVETRAQF